jgi:hypothetical protein
VNIVSANAVENAVDLEEDRHISATLLGLVRHEDRVELGEGLDGGADEACAVEHGGEAGGLLVLAHERLGALDTGVVVPLAAPRVGGDGDLTEDQVLAPGHCGQDIQRLGFFPPIP